MYKSHIYTKDELLNMDAEGFDYEYASGILFSIKLILKKRIDTRDKINQIKEIINGA